MTFIPPQADSAGALTRITHGSFTHQPQARYYETIDNGENLKPKTQDQIRHRQADTIERIHKLLQRQSKQVNDSMDYAEGYIPDQHDRIDIMAAVKLREAVAKSMAILMLNYKEVFSLESTVYDLDKPDTNAQEKDKAAMNDTLIGIDDRLKRLTEAKSEFSDLAKNIFEANPIGIENK